MLEHLDHANILSIFMSKVNTAVNVFYLSLYAGILVSVLFLCDLIPNSCTINGYFFCKSICLMII